MRKVISSVEAQAFKARWSAVSVAEIAELRATPIAVKARQLAALMASMKALDWTHAPADDEQARERWNRLRKTLARV